VTVTGSPESIEASASTILTHVEEDNFGRIDNNLDYDMFCYSNYWGGYHGYGAPPRYVEYNNRQSRARGRS